MSAFMVNNKTLTIIAKYMADCANNDKCGRLGRNMALRPIEFSEAMLAYLEGRGCLDKSTGLFLAQSIHKVLVDENRKALVARYGEDDGKEMGGGDGYEPFNGEISIDTREDTRREWLVNLYEVTRCYLYQISEGDYRSNPFYAEMVNWLNQMAAVLAGYVVDEIRPRFVKMGVKHKCWDEF